jgi:hypothetical protein
LQLAPPGSDAVLQNLLHSRSQALAFRIGPRPCFGHGLFHHTNILAHLDRCSTATRVPPPRTRPTDPAERKPRSYRDLCLEPGRNRSIRENRDGAV